MTNENGALSNMPDVDNLDFIEGATPVQQPEPPTSESQPDPVTFEINPNDIYGSIRKLADSDPKVANVLNSMVGMKARTEYEPRLQKTELELSRLRRELAQRDISAIPEAERAGRIANDPETRQKDDLAKSPDNYPQQQEALRVRGTILSTLEGAINNGLSPERAEEFLKNLQEGTYDKDEQGNILSTEDSLRRLNNDVFKALPRTAPVDNTQQQAPVNTLPAPTQQQQAPPRDSASPDLSSQSSNIRGQRFTKTEIDRMTPDQFINTFPNDSDYEAAIRDGRVEGISQETVEYLRNS